MKFVLVTGASGYLGRHVVAELKRNGHRVRALVRQRDPLWKRSEQLAPAVGSEVDEIIMGDLTQPGHLQGLCNQIQCVISCASLSNQDAKKFSPEQVDYQGHRNLLAEAIRAGSVEKFIYVSMAPRLGAAEPLAQAKEKFVKELQESVMTSYTIRPTLYYAELISLLYMAHQGTLWLPGDSQRKFNPIHGQDLAEICIKGMIAKEKEIEVGGAESLSFYDCAQLAFKAQKKASRILPIPEPLAGLAQGWLSVFGRQQLHGYKSLRSPFMHSKVAPAYGKQKLADYFQQYVESPFFRP